MTPRTGNLIVVSQPVAEGSEEYNPYLPASRQAMPGPERPPEPERPAKPPPPRHPDVIEAELAATRTRLAAAIDEMQGRLKPSAIAKRSFAGLQEKVTTPSGAPRPEVIAAAAVFVLGVALITWRRRRR